jgi:predicted flap endonuclease-1-like 5' DNA nuclease
MPEITVVHITLLTLAVGVGVVAGWVLRGNRCAEEKIAVNSGWQEQLEAQRTEHARLLDQNQSLMEQVNQNQASGKDATNRAKELSGALKEAFERRDELQREIKDVRNTLESAVGERDKLQANMESLSASDDSQGAALQAKDEKITRLTRDLEGWRDRLPPLIERFRVRNEEAEQLEADLAKARDRIEALEAMPGSDETHVEALLDTDATHIEAVDPESISDDLDASNDPDDVAGDAEGDTEGDEDAASGEMLAADDILEEDDDVDDIIDSDDETHVEEHSFDEESVNDAPDDLKLIKGIGPAIEKTLNELGIIRLGQIADMSEYDIDRVAKRLKGFRSRIYREDWIGQARDLRNRQASEQA